MKLYKIEYDVFDNFNDNGRGVIKSACEINYDEYNLYCKDHGIGGFSTKYVIDTFGYRTIPVDVTDLTFVNIEHIEDGGGYYLDYVEIMKELKAFWRNELLENIGI